MSSVQRGVGTMRLIFLVMAFFASVPLIGRADDAATVVEKAVGVMANSDLRLNRLRTVVRSEHGTINLPMGEMQVQRTAYLNPPERIKYDATLTIDSRPQTMVLALNGVNGWQKAGPALKDLTQAEYDVIQDEAYVWYLSTLLPLRQKGAVVKSAPPLTINGRPAVGVSVARPNRSDVQLYFDAASSLPIKVKIKVREVGIEVLREYDLSGHKDFDGIKLPTKITIAQNGKKIEDWTIDGYRTPDRLEDKVFAKPR
jgi:hypothetical protein